MSGLDKVIVSSLANVAKDSGKLNTAIDKIREKVLAKGLELVEEAGIDSSQLPVNVPQYLRGESPSAPDTLSTPENVFLPCHSFSFVSPPTIQLKNDDILKM
mgnify:CR=1 FL=1